MFIYKILIRLNYFVLFFLFQLFTVTIGDLAAEFPAEPEKGLRHYLDLSYKNQPSVCMYAH